MLDDGRSTIMHTVNDGGVGSCFGLSGQFASRGALLPAVSIFLGLSDDPSASLVMTIGADELRDMREVVIIVVTVVLWPVSETFRVSGSSPCRFDDDFPSFYF